MLSLLIEPSRKNSNNTKAQGVLRCCCDEQAMDGAAPELNPGRVQRRINSNTGAQLTHNTEINTADISHQPSAQYAPLLIEPSHKNSNHTKAQGVLRCCCDKRAMDGAAPELNPGRVHRRINSNTGAQPAHNTETNTADIHHQHNIRGQYRITDVVVGAADMRLS